MTDESLEFRLRSLEIDAQQTLGNTLDLKAETLQIQRVMREHRDSTRGEFGLVRSDISDVRTDLAEFRADTAARFDGVDARFESVDARFDNVDARFDNVDARFDAMEALQRQILDRLRPK